MKLVIHNKYQISVHVLPVGVQKLFDLLWILMTAIWPFQAGLILGLRPANERRRYFVTTSLIGGAQA